MEREEINMLQKCKQIFFLFQVLVMIICIQKGSAFAAVVPDNGTRYTVLVLDVSGSMEGRPISSEKAAAQKFCESMLASEGINYIAIIAYSDYPMITCEFTSDRETLTQSLNNIASGGGTDSNAALQKALEFIESVPENATKNIVFLSDGLPQAGSTSMTGPYAANDSRYYKYANALYETAKSVREKCRLYTLGFFHKLSGSELSFAEKLLGDMQNAGYYNVDNVDDLEFTFGEISEDILESISEKRYIEQHKKYYSSKQYEAEITADYPESILQIYQDTLSDNTVLGYDILDALNKYLSFNTGKLSGSDEYKILLSEIIAGQMDIEKFYQENTKAVACDMYSYFLDIMGTSSDFMKDETFKEFLKEMKKYYAVMQQSDYGTEQFENAYNMMKKMIGQNINVKEAIKDIKKYQTKYSTIFDLTQVTVSTVEEVLDYYIAAQSYLCMTKDMKDVLTKLKGNISDNNIRNKIIKENSVGLVDGQVFLDSLQNAVTEYMDAIETVETGNAHEIARFVLAAGGSNAVVLAQDKFSDFLWSKMPLMYGFKKTSKTIQTLVQFGAPTTVLRAYSSNLLARLRYIHMFMKHTVDNYGVELSNASNSDDAFQAALHFDAGINLYKAIQMLACDYAEQYENCCFESNTDKMNYIERYPLSYGLASYIVKRETIKKRSWNSMAGCMAQVQKLDTQVIKCHNGNFSFDSSGVVHYENDKLKIIAIACPVAVTVTDEAGKQIAYLSDNEQNILNGYEPYFNVYKDNEQVGTCIKTALIPADKTYEIMLAGTGTGTMDIYVVNCNNYEISDMEYVVDIPVDSNARMNLNLQNGHEALETSNNSYPLLNAEQDLDLKVQTEWQKKVGDPSFNLNVVCSNGSVIYGVDTDQVVSVDEKGNVQIIGPGIAAITITASNGIVTEHKTLNIQVTEDISNCHIYLTQDAYEYNGGEHRPNVEVNYSGRQLTVGKDYDLIYTDNINVGTASVTIIGKGNFTGSTTKMFSINEKEKRNISSCDVILDAEQFVYTGVEQWPSVIIRDGFTALNENIDYVVTHENCVEVGTGSLIITGIGEYEGVIVKPFWIRKASQDIIVVKKIKKVYGSKPFKLKASIIKGDGDLTYKSSNNKVVSVSSSGKVKIKSTGRAVITIKAAATRNHKSKNIKTAIVVHPKKQKINKVSFINKRMHINWNKDKQATGYQIQVCVKKNFKHAKTVSVKKNGITLKALKKNGKCYIRVRSYKNISVKGRKKRLYGSWSQIWKK